MEDILNCPFCGGMAVLNLKYGDFNMKVVYCSRCYCMQAPFGTAEEAITAWNSRVEIEVGS